MNYDSLSYHFTSLNWFSLTQRGLIGVTMKWNSFWMHAEPTVWLTSLSFTNIEVNRTPSSSAICLMVRQATAYFNLSFVVMRHDIPDIGTMSEQYPHLVFHNMKTPLGQRVMNAIIPTKKARQEKALNWKKLVHVTSCDVSYFQFPAFIFQD